MQYLAQDFSWNSRDNFFQLLLHQNILATEVLDAINQSFGYNVRGNLAEASTEIANFSIIVLCRCKKGRPEGIFSVRLERGDKILVEWPGVSRMFVRVRIMESVSLNGLKSMLIDDMESQYSVSDSEIAEENQSFRPWSDDEYEEAHGSEYDGHDVNEELEQSVFE